MVKKSFLLMLSVLMLLTATAFADVQIIDDARLITVEEMVLMLNIIESVEEKHQVDLVVLTTEDTPYDDTYEMYYVRNYADDFYDNGGYGMGPDDSGMLILLDMHNRVMWLSTAGVMMEYINDSREESILDDAYEYLSYGEYGKAIIAALETTSYYMDKGREEGTFLYDEVTGERLSGVYNALTSGEMLAAGVGGVFVALWMLLGVGSSYDLKGSTYRYDRQENGDLSFTRNDETFLHRTVTRRARPQHTSSGGGGGRSSGGGGVHRSSGGVSHGGGGRRF